jgi:hypothetical protein
MTRIAARGLRLLALAIGLAGCQLERLDPRAVGGGLAQLTARDVAMLTSVLNADTKCGFASPGVVASAQVVGATGYAGTVTWTVKGCALDFGASTELSIDCGGLRTTAGGLVVVDATRTVVGTLTGDAKNPVVPSTAEGARIEGRAEPKGFWVLRSDSPYRVLHRAPMNWVAAPKLAVSASLGVCAVATNELTLSHVRFEAGTVEMDLGDRTFPVEVERSDFSVQFGRWGARENSIDGVIRIWGGDVALPAKPEQPALDLGYDAAGFVAAYACDPELAKPVSFACPSLAEVMAQGVARLMVMNTGAIASAINDDQRCGFSNTLRLLRPDRVEGESGELGLMAWSVDHCELAFPSVTLQSTNCLQEKTSVHGTAVVSAERVVTGLREKKYLVVRSISPRSRNAVTIRLTDVRLDGFVAFSIASGQAEPRGKLTLTEGRLSGTVIPYLGERASAAGVYDVSTPVAEFQALQLVGAKAVLESGGSVFAVELPEVRLSAQNGSYGGRSNALAGEVRVNGTTVRLDPMPLDPTFDQASFDLGYACTPDLREVIPAR